MNASNTSIRITAALAAAAIALTLTACGGSKTVAEKTLTVCTNPPYAPFEEVVNQEIVGFDIDLMKEVAKDMDAEISFIEATFETIESAQAFEQGLCEVGASALTITDARAEKVDFSSPYYTANMGLLVRTDAAITSSDDLAGKAVGVQQGTTGEDWARANLLDSEIRQYEGLGDQVTALKAGDVVGIINDEPTLEPHVSGELALANWFAPGEPEVFGFAVKKGNAELLATINKTLERINSDGTYDTIFAKWFL
jgi:polar amino acid transport system substrate-binding protein